MNEIILYSASSLNASGFSKKTRMPKERAPFRFESLRLELVMARDDYHLLILIHVVKLRERIVSWNLAADPKDAILLNSPSPGLIRSCISSKDSC